MQGAAGWVRMTRIGAPNWSNHMPEVTRILSAIERDDPSAAEQLLPLVCNELRRLAAQKLAEAATSFS